MNCPCRLCDLLYEDKNNDICKGCPYRVVYVIWIEKNCPGVGNYPSDDEREEYEIDFGKIEPIY